MKLIPTVTIKHKSSGAELVINQSDWAEGNLPGINLGSEWSAVTEDNRGGDEGHEAGEEARKLAQTAHENQDKAEERAKAQNAKAAGAKDAETAKKA